jgi:hypothetical protein
MMQNAYTNYTCYDCGYPLSKQGAWANCKKHREYMCKHTKEYFFVVRFWVFSREIMFCIDCTTFYYVRSVGKGVKEIWQKKIR